MTVVRSRRELSKRGKLAELTAATTIQRLPRLFMPRSARVLAEEGWVGVEAEVEEGFREEERKGTRKDEGKRVGAVLLS